MKILLAEDDRELSKVLVTILKMNKYIVDAVNNGTDAVAYADNMDYDIIILDVMMPKKNGFEALSEIREHRNYTPVLMLTAKSGLKDRVTGLDLGADDYLGKPFEMEELLARLRVLSRRKHVAVKNYQFGDLVLNIKTYTLTCGDKSEILSGKEYSVFKLLIEANGAVITTDSIIDSAWDYDNPADTSNVMIFITKLRRKLEALRSRVSIKSLKGVGYCLTEKKYD